jgi:hypothetical protein
MIIGLNISESLVAARRGARFTFAFCFYRGSSGLSGAGSGLKGPH